MNKLIKFAKSLVIDKNETYDRYAFKYQAKTLGRRIFYLLAYLLPGIMAFLIVNVKVFHDALSNTFGFKGYDFQYFIFVLFTLGWHIGWPLYMLKKWDGLNWRQVIEFLSLDRFSLKEVLVVAPLYFIASVVLSLPYMLFFYGDFQTWLSAIELFKIPSYSIFGSYEAFYGAPMLVLFIMLVGNFVGEEIYFRGYLMKKTAFLGKYNWLVNSVLFCIYHLWQIPQSVPLIVPFLFFGLVMQMRKNLYTIIMFHLLFNLAGVQIYNVILGLGGR
ncbi:MAG: CPBP family intramembrane metalloprotease [Reichenbachiella sp.]